jgi:hypothetical protein
MREREANYRCSFFCVQLYHQDNAANGAIWITQTLREGGREERREGGREWGVDANQHVHHSNAFGLHESVAAREQDGDQIGWEHLKEGRSGVARYQLEWPLLPRPFGGIVYSTTQLQRTKPRQAWNLRVATNLLDIDVALR